MHESVDDRFLSYIVSYQSTKAEFRSQMVMKLNFKCFYIQ